MIGAIHDGCIPEVWRYGKEEAKEIIPLQGISDKLLKDFLTGEKNNDAYNSNKTKNLQERDILGQTIL